MLQKMNDVLVPSIPVSLLLRLLLLPLMLLLFVCYRCWFCPSTCLCFRCCRCCVDGRNGGPQSLGSLDAVEEAHELVTVIKEISD